MPDCWSRPIEYIVNSWNGSFTYPMIQNYNTSSSTKALLMRSIAKKSAYIVSPPIISDISAMKISFIAKAENNNFKGKLEVGIMSVIDDIKTFIHIQDIYLSATDNIEYTIPLINQTLYGGGNSVAFKYTSDNQNS